MNFLGNATWINNSALNRYTLASLSLEEIQYEEYFLQIVILRFRMVVGIWLLSKLIPKKIVAVGFAVIICVTLGCVAAMSILANGVWGLLFFVCIMMPHILCYASAWGLWNRGKQEAVTSEKNMEWCIVTALIIVLVGIGCILEAYVSPVLVKSVIKY